MRKTYVILGFMFPFFLLNVVGCSNDDDKSTGNELTNKSSHELKTTGQKPSEGPTSYKSETEAREGTDQKLNHPPVVKSIRIQSTSGTETDDGFRAIVEAKDPDNDVVSFSYQWNLNEEPISGATDETLEWSEDFKKGSIISVDVIPFDGKDEGVWKAEGSFTIPNSPPIITSEPPSDIENGKFSYVLKAEDPDGDPLDYTLKNAPEGMMIEPATGLITWDFDEGDEGEYMIEIIVTDSEGAKASQVLTLNISPRQTQ